MSLENLNLCGCPLEQQPNLCVLEFFVFARAFLYCSYTVVPIQFRISINAGHHEPNCSSTPPSTPTLKHLGFCIWDRGYPRPLVAQKTPSGRARELFGTHSKIRAKQDKYTSLECHYTMNQSKEMRSGMSVQVRRSFN